MTFFNCRHLTTPVFPSRRLFSVLSKLRHEKNSFRSGVTPWRVSPGAVRLPSLVTPLLLLPNWLTDILHWRRYSISEKLYVVFNETCVRRRLVTRSLFCSLQAKAESAYFSVNPELDSLVSRSLFPMFSITV